MDPGDGRLYPVFDEADAKRRGLVPVRRELTAIEHRDQQIKLYSPCACDSGEKFKFCCYRPPQPEKQP